MAYNRRQRHLFGVVMSGLERPGAVRFLTLTSGPGSPSDIHHSFAKLKQRIRRRFKFEYVAVREVGKGGMVHLHIVYRGDYIPQAWLSYHWNQIHRAPVVWISQVKKGAGVGHEMVKYLTKESMERYWTSWGWIYRGWRKVRDLLFAYRWGWGLGDCWSVRIAMWKAHLRGSWLKLGTWMVAPP